MNIKFKILSILLLPLYSFSLFEDLGFGARLFGMGNASTSIVNDSYSIYYNPAGLSYLQYIDINLGYNRHWIGLTDGSNIGNGYFAIGVPFSNIGIQELTGTVGLGYLNLNLSGFYQEHTIFFSYGTSIAHDTSLGMNLKFLLISFSPDNYMKTDPLFSKYGTSSSGTTVDVGCIYRGIKGYSFGIFISNFILTKIGIKDKDTVPVLIKLGIAHRYYPYFDASLDIVYSQTGFGLCAGIEKKFENKYFLRGGFGWFQNEKRYITIGAGYNIKLFQIDYSFFFPLSGMTSTYGSHRFSLNIRIGNVPIEDETSFREIPLIPKAMYDEELEKVRKELKDALEMIDKLRREVNINQQKLNEMTKLASSLAERLERMEKGERKVVVVERPSSKPEKPRFYTVKEGDTLKSIAKQIYNDESKWIDIYKANQDKVKQGLLTPGDVLVIP